MADTVTILNPIEDIAFKIDDFYTTVTKETDINLLGSEATYMRFNLSQFAGKTIKNVKLVIYPRWAISSGESNTYLKYKLINVGNLETITTDQALTEGEALLLNGFVTNEVSRDAVKTSITYTLNNGAFLNGLNTILCYIGWTTSNITGLVFFSSETINKPQLIVTYNDTPVDAPRLKYPIGLYVNLSVDNTFSWDYLSQSGDVQGKFDLQYSVDGLNWTTISQTTSNNYCIIPAGTLPGGNIKWRVQTYNSTGAASGYSEAAIFYSIGAPLTPSVYSITTNTAKPIISWRAGQQEVYRVQVLQGGNIIYDTGSQPYKNYSHKVAVFLADGDYTAKVRVQNGYEMWSQWSESLFTITTTKPAKPEVIFQTVKNGIEAVITNTVAAAYFLLLRNGTAVYKTASRNLYDYTAENGKEYQYKIRAVSEEDTYSDSSIKLMSTNVSGNIFAPVEDLGCILEFKINLNQQPEKSFKSSAVINTMYCAGRKYPIVDKSEHMEKSMSFVFYTEDYNKVENLNELVENYNTVLFRDSKGKKMYGSVVNLSSTEVKTGYQVSFALNATDYMEGMEYA